MKKSWFPFRRSLETPSRSHRSSILDVQLPSPSKKVSFLPSPKGGRFLPKAGFRTKEGHVLPKAGFRIGLFLPLALFFVLFVLSLGIQSAFADVGNTTNHNSGGGGGSSFGGGGSFYSFYMLNFLFRLLFRYPLIGIPLLLFVIYRWSSSRSSGSASYRGSAPSYGGSSAYSPPPSRQAIPSPLPPHRIADIGEDFDEVLFLSKVANMFVQLQEAWTKKRWELVRAFEHDTVFQVHKKQLDEYIRKDQTNVMEDIAVLNSYICGYSFNSTTMVQTIQVLLDTKFRDYIVEDKSGKVLQGSPDRVIYSTYNWTLIRTKNSFKTVDPYNLNTCPHCGAPTANINESGVCPYCGSNISKGDYDWVLVKIDKLAQR